MDWGIAWENINYLAVLIAAVSPFILGFFWYSPQGFMKPWMKEAKLTPKQVNDKEAMPAIFGGSFALNLITAFILGLLMYNTDGVIDGAIFGSVIGLAFAAAAKGQNYLFERRSLSLFAINGGYDIAAMTLMGIIFGVLG